MHALTFQTVLYDEIDQDCALAVNHFIKLQLLRYMADYESVSVRRMPPRPNTKVTIFVGKDITSMYTCTMQTSAGSAFSLSGTLKPWH